jgi:MarR family transcriptional regulator, lower aerobic nicotinate degradation pathway regulator
MSGEASDAAGAGALELTDYLFHLFAVVSRHREARLDAALRRLGLSLSRHRALSIVSGIAPCTMSELSEFSAVDRTTLTRTVDQLVESGLVERATPREDRRQVVLTLTEAGRETCGRSMQAIFDVNRELAADMSDDERRAAVRMLQALLGRLAPDPALRERLLLRDDRTADWAPPK